MHGKILNFSKVIFEKKTPVSNFIKLRPVEAGFRTE